MLTREDPVSFSKGIQKMFSDIAPRYDFLNALLSCRRDRYWRKSAVDELSLRKGGVWLDLATGTGDVALEITSRIVRENVKVVGVDFSRKMLVLAAGKIRARNMQTAIDLLAGAAENLALRDDSFNGAVTAFGVRNFSDAERGLREIWRVLKSNGELVILEFSFPANPVLRLGYRLYFDWLLPFVGKIVSGHSNAYGYLSRSVSAFPERNDFARIIENAGFTDVTYRDMTFGIVTLYTGRKDA